MKVLVIGGAGFIGSHTVDRLIERGHDVTVFDLLSPRVHPHGPPGDLNPNARFVVGDVCNRLELEPVLRNADAVFNFAAYQDYLPDFSTFFRVNDVGTALIYEIILDLGLSMAKVVVASSQAVYGEGKYACNDHGVQYPDIRNEEQLAASDWEVGCPVCGKPCRNEWTDESRTNPHNQYAVSKLCQEMITTRLGRLHGIPSVALRYSIVQGPRQSFYNAYSGVCRLFCLANHFGRRPIVYEDGSQLRDFVNIHDVVDANMMVFGSDEADYEVFNVGGGRACSVKEFCSIVSGVYGSSMSPEISGKYRFGDTRHILSDIGKLKRIGWSPSRSIEYSVESYKAWLDQHPEVVDSLKESEYKMQAVNVVRRAR